MPQDRRYPGSTDRDRYWRWRERPYPQGGYREETGYGEFDREWQNDDMGGQYYGTGSHYGGGFGTAPSSRASSEGTPGASGYAGQGAWSDPADWTPEDEERADVVSYRGRGPKGYMRSDERLLETICERLTDDPRIDASDIQVEVKQQAVTLRGNVNHRRTKYAVEELVEDCGVRDIDNQLRVTSNR